ncbi:MAG TPA: hypothetical protein VIU34_07380 [Steroidobacter sp.]
MKKTSGGIGLLLAAVLIFGMTLAGLCAAQAPVAADFIVPTMDKQCDEFNRSWVVSNKHTYLSIKVQVKWSAVGAKEMQEEFILSPGEARAIGCASKLDILSAEIMQF